VSTTGSSALPTLFFWLRHQRATRLRRQNSSQSVPDVTLQYSALSTFILSSIVTSLSPRHTEGKGENDICSSFPRDNKKKSHQKSQKDFGKT
jgi:hypothetical protein